MLFVGRVGFVGGFLLLCSFVMMCSVSGGQRFWKGPTDDQILGGSLGHDNVSLTVGGLGL